MRSFLHVTLFVTLCAFALAETCKPKQELVNGKCVRRCRSNQIRNDAGLCEKKCMENATLKGSKCVCDDGFQKVGKKCKPDCGENAKLKVSTGKCVCLKGYEKKNGKCVEAGCAEGEVRRGSKCYCKDGFSRVSGKCLKDCASNEKRNDVGVCECKKNFELFNKECIEKCGKNSRRKRNGVCVCLLGFEMLEDERCRKIRCPVREILDGNKCYCKPGTERIDGNCLKKCKATQKRVGTFCECRKNYTSVGGDCVKKCPNKEILKGRRCICDPAQFKNCDGVCRKSDRPCPGEGDEGDDGPEPTEAPLKCAPGSDDAVDVPVNVASAQQGPNSWPGGEANKALDDKHGGDWNTDRCAITMIGANPWWQVELAQPSWITAVTIQDRTDAPFNNRLKNFQVLLDGQLCVHYPGVFPDRETLQCDKPVFGKTLKITKPDSDHLQICDVVVKGVPGGSVDGVTCNPGNTNYILPPGECDLSLDGSIDVPVNVASAEQGPGSWPGGEADKALDDKHGGDWNTDRCAITMQGANPWWQVDVAEPSWITGVTIQDRTDTPFHLRLKNFKVFVDNNLCLHYPGNFPDRETLACDKPVFGTTIKVTKPDSDHLQICDFVVKGSPGGKTSGKNACNIPTPPEKPKIVELARPARQGPGSWPGGEADKAIDDKHGGDWNTDRCAITMPGPNPWWEVDFVEPRWVTAVEIQDRTDAPFHLRLKNFKVLVDGQLCVHYPGNFPSRETLQCDQPVYGGTLRITKPDPDHLQLCDVVVHYKDGKAPPKPDHGTPPSIADSKAVSLQVDSARQGPGSWPGGEAGKALDDKHGGDWNTDRCAITMTGPNPWWEVDFVKPQWVTAVEIQDRTDAPFHLRLKNFQILVDGKQCAHYPGNFPDRETVNCDKPLFGKTLRITKPDPDHLQLCDVVVKGG